MSRFAVVACLVFAFTSFAGKPERDKQKELQPKVDAAAATLKTTCGCTIKVAVKWDTYKTADLMGKVGYIAESIDVAAKAQCQSDDDKKALCSNVSTIEIAYNKDSCEVTIKGKIVTATSNECNAGEHQFKAVFEKF